MKKTEFKYFALAENKKGYHKGTLVQFTTFPRLSFYGNEFVILTDAFFRGVNLKKKSITVNYVVWVDSDLRIRSYSKVTRFVFSKSDTVTLSLNIDTDKKCIRGKKVDNSEITKYEKGL